MKGNSGMLYGIIIFLIAVCFVLVCFIAVCAKRDREIQTQTEEKLKTYKDYNMELINANNTLSVELKAFREENKRLAEDNEGYLQILKKMLAEREKAEQAEQVAREEPKPNENAAKERLPEGVATNRYDCEGYKFPTGSQQAMLQEECLTDWGPQTAGLRYYFDGKGFYYCVAMGGAYGIDIGDAWRVTLRNGSMFNVTLADYQHDITEPDPNDFGERYEYDKDGNIVGPLRNYDGEECVHVLEFIADLKMLPRAAKEAGGMHGIDFFGGKFGDGGNIVKMEYLGRVWEP